MATCKVTSEVYGNIWFKQMIFENKGDIKEGHVHNFDHITFLTNGSVEIFEIIFNDEKQNIGEFSLGVFHAPEYIKVPSGKAHSVKAIEDKTVAYCLEAVRDGGVVITTNFNDPEWKESSHRNFIDRTYK